jgi:hypothetical protein
MSLRRTSAVVLAGAVCALSGSAIASPLLSRAQVFTGYGFDTCNAPAPTTLAAWAASPYRAVGIYVGGVNRACSNGNLSASWVAAAVAAGWALAPLYVGRQAPCATQHGLVTIDGADAPAEGRAAADDAADRAGSLALPPGSPIYFDMEGYATNDFVCTRVVQAFLSAWTDELHARGYVSGIYGSAASTMRDLVSLAASPTAVIPDGVWIANWNGQPAVFGDPYVPDALWANHQRLHQFTGGHRETYGGVGLQVDSNYVDGQVVAASAPVAPSPAPSPSSPTGSAGSVGSGDGEAVASWTADALPSSALVMLTPTQIGQPLPGLGTGYAAQLAATDTTTGQSVATFAAPVTIAFKVVAPGAVPVASSDGSEWHRLPRLARATLPAGQSAGFTLEPDGTTDVLTLTPGLFGVLRDTSPPAAPGGLAGRFSHGSLVLTWPRAVDSSGSIGSYRITIDGHQLLAVPGSVRRAVLRTFHPDRLSVYRVLAVDVAGNESAPSAPVRVLPAARPEGVPARLPGWAWELFHWQQRHRASARPVTPRPLPAWYWKWAAWRLRPFRVVG